ncbi:MAG: hypothetical protein LBQ33_04495, partial [Oscillospiraceae bacterium]|nr:hypothetical protein [Oscillospiraceae bacterium]
MAGMKRRPRVNQRGSKLFRKYFCAILAILLFSFVFLGSAFMIFSLRYWTADKLALLSENSQRTARMTEVIYAEQTEPTSGGGSRRQLLHSLLLATAQVLDADFFLCNAEGKVVACLETVSDTLLPAPVQCPAHRALRFSEKTVQRALAGSLTQIGT